MPSDEDRASLKRAIETSIRVGLIALLVIACLLVVRPFVQPMVWGIILAIAVHPAYVRLPISGTRTQRQRWCLGSTSRWSRSGWVTPPRA